MHNFALTAHAIQRLRERNPSFAKQWDDTQEPALRKKLAYDFFSQSVEEKSFLNNTTYVVKLSEQYGYDKKFKVFVKDDSIFLGMIDGDRKIIMTVLSRKDCSKNHLAGKRVKYNSVKGS